MSAKNRDRSGRWRNHTIAFRVTPEENDAINKMVKLSGLTKQDYLTANMLNKGFTIKGSPRVYKALKEEMEAISQELSRLEKASDISQELMELISVVNSIVDGMKEGGTYGE